MATVAQKSLRHTGGMNRVTDAVIVTVLNQANTDFTFNVPAGARDVKLRTRTTTAFTAVTDAQLSIGKTVGGAEYVAAVSIKAAALVELTLVAAQAIADLETVPGTIGSMATFTGRVVQSGGSTAVGQATLFVEYSLPV